jgi:hypothetical protein
MSHFWLNTVKQVQAIAQTGLFYVTNPFDRGRYDQIESLAYEFIVHYSKN